MRANGKTFLGKVFNLEEINIKLARIYISEITLLLEFSDSSYFPKLHECFVCSNHFFLVMEWEKCITLSEMLKINKKVNIWDINNILWNIGCALKELHLRDYIFRNLCARNIAVSRNSQGNITSAKLINFDDCKITDEIYSLECNSKFLPVEHTYSKESDVWAFGLLSYRLFHGRSLLKKQEASDSIWLNQSDPLTSTEEKYPEFITECLKLDPICRPKFSEIVELPYFHTLPVIVQTI